MSMFTTFRQRLAKRFAAADSISQTIDASIERWAASIVASAEANRRLAQQEQQAADQLYAEINDLANQASEVTFQSNRNAKRADDLLEQANSLAASLGE
jgi:F0F1-type ATP synthase membrane subunit b/b'